jgi:hypothetical protein
MGMTTEKRVNFLQYNYNEAKRLLGVGSNQAWKTLELGTEF